MGRRSNGEGTFIITPDGKYKLKVQVGYKEDGKPKYLTVTEKTKSACLKRMRKRKLEYQRELKSSGCFSDRTLTELCQAHLEAHLLQRDRLKPKSADSRESTINNQIAKHQIGSMTVANITPKDITDHIESLISENRLSVSRIEKTYDVINSAFKWGISNSKLEDNPCIPVKDEIQNRFKKLKKREENQADVVILSAEEQTILCSECRKRFMNGKYRYNIGLAVLLLLYTGIRVGELCALTWGDWHRQTNTLSISKTCYVARNRKKPKSKNIKTAKYIVEVGDSTKNVQSREIELSSEAKAILEESYQLAGTTNDKLPIFPNEKGKVNNPSNFDDSLKTIYTNAGLTDIGGAHILRHTFATDMYDATKDIKAVAEYIGDTTETVIKHYIAARRRIRVGNETRNIVPLPTNKDKRDNSNNEKNNSSEPCN